MDAGILNGLRPHAIGVFLRDPVNLTCAPGDESHTLETRSRQVLALTAKAIKSDREKCLDARASDPIAKPVNTDQLLSLMRGWLLR